MRKVGRHNSTRRSITLRRPNRIERHRTEVSAGGIIFKNTSQGIMIAMLQDSYKKWTFPKGHVRKGESYNRTALREIEEEVGLTKLKSLGKLGDIDVWFRDRFVHKGKIIHKYIHYYLFEADSNACLVKQEIKESGERIHDVKWVSVSEIEAKSNYVDMKSIVQKAIGKITFDNKK